VILFFFNILDYVLLPKTAEVRKNHLKEKVRTWGFYHEIRREQVTRVLLTKKLESGYKRHH